MRSVAATAGTIPRMKEKEHGEVGGDPCPATIRAHAAIADTIPRMEKKEHDEMGTVDAAEHLGLTPGTLATLRHYRRGPAFSKDQRGRVSYRVADLDAWRAQHPARRRATT